jgi:hypothetical protein
MKFVILVVAAAGLGASAIFAVPSAVLQSGYSSVQGLVADSGLTQLKLADLNPLRAIFDFEQQRIQAGQTPDQLGFHGSAAKLGPMWTPPSQPAFGTPQHQNNQPSDPMGWNGAPPH